MSGRIKLNLKRKTGFELHVDVEVPDNGVTVLFGPSGCGKTTVLRSVAGLERARGYVELAGNVWQDDERGIFVPTCDRCLGYVFQEACLFDHLSVRANLEFGMKRRKQRSSSQQLAHAVELLGIGNLLDRRPQELSGGERQRCGIARSLATLPDVLLMDEPMAALDRERRMEIMPWLEKLRRELSIPILYITHADDELMRLCDTLVLMDKGHVRCSGNLTDVLSQSSVAKHFAANAASVIEASVLEKEPSGLACVTAAGSRLWVEDSGLAVGEKVRLKVCASDISLALKHHQDTSIQNIVPVTVESIEPMSSQASLMVRLVGCDGMILHACITRRSAEGLNLRPGMTVFAQIKSVSIIGCRI